MQAEITNLESALQEYSDDVEESTEIQYELDSYNESIEQDKEYITFYQDRLEKIKLTEYKAQEAVSYELSIETDSSGNNATEETLTYTCETLDFENYLDAGDLTDGSDAPDSAYVSEEHGIEFHNGTTAQTIYDTLFAGYDELFTIVKSNANPYTLDSRDSEGVTVK